MPFTSYPVALMAVFNLASSTGPSEMIAHTAHHTVYFHSCFDHVVILHFCYYNAVKSIICHYKLELANRNYSICFFLLQ